MVYQVIYGRKFKKSIKKADKKYLTNIRDRVNSLTQNPRPTGCEKLVGMNDLYRIRIGDNRVIYQITDKELLVFAIDVDHRRRIYANH